MNRGSTRALIWLRSRWVLVAFAFLFIVLGVYFFFTAGNFLVREDPLGNAQAVLVLSGSLPARALSAAEIYRSGYAREVWLTAPAQPRASMEELKLPYAGEEEYSRMVLISKGVSPASIRILKNKIGNTEDEMRVLAETIKDRPERTIIVMTSKSHTRRVRALWSRLGSSRTHLIVRAASEEHFDQDHWWRTTNDALTVVREYLGLLNAWAGLPLHHTN